VIFCFPKSEDIGLCRELDLNFDSLARLVIPLTCLQSCGWHILTMCRYTCTTSIFRKGKIFANFATLVKFNRQLSFPQLSYLYVKLLSHFKISSTINIWYCIPTIQQTKSTKSCEKQGFSLSVQIIEPNHTFVQDEYCPLYFHTSRFCHKTSRIYPDHCRLSCHLP